MHSHEVLANMVVRVVCYLQADIPVLGVSCCLQVPCLVQCFQPSLSLLLHFLLKLWKI